MAEQESWEPLFVAEVYSASQTVKGRAWDSEESCLRSKPCINTGLSGTALSNFLKMARNYFLSNMIKRGGTPNEKGIYFSPETPILYFLRMFLRKWPGYWMDSSSESVNYSRKKHEKEGSTGKIRKRTCSSNLSFSSSKLYRKEEEN